MSTTKNNYGTARWMAPERLKANEPFRRTTATDVYAYGCLCYTVRSELPYSHANLTWRTQLYTHNPPFHTLTDIQVMHQVAYRDNRPVRPDNTACHGIELTDPLWDLITRCWATEPHTRPDMATMVEYFHLSRTRAGTPSQASSIVSELTSRVPSPDLSQPTSTAISPKSSRVRMNNGRVSRLALVSQNVKLSFPEVNIVCALLVTKHYISVASDDLAIRVYDRATGNLLHILTGHRQRVSVLAGTEDTLVSGGEDGQVRVWSFASGRCTHLFAEHGHPVTCLVLVKPMVDVPPYAPDRSLIVTGSEDNTVMVWNLPQIGDTAFHSILDRDGFMVSVGRCHIKCTCRCSPLFRDSKIRSSATNSGDIELMYALSRRMVGQSYLVGSIKKFAYGIYSRTFLLFEHYVVTKKRVHAV
jgi:WD40 repeat protein